MKVLYRISVLALLCTVGQAAGAQTIHDALRFSREDLYGSARSMAMGNAMTAIGGDIGALSVNPAATGVYRYSEFVITPGLDSYTGTSNYLGSSAKDSKTRFILGNVGFVGYVPTGHHSGLLNINWSVSGNQTGGYVSRTAASGRDAASSWLASKADQATLYGYNSDALSYTSGAPWDINAAYQSWQLNNFWYGDTPDNYTYLANTENMDLTTPNGRLDQQYSRESWGYTYDFTANVSGNVSNKFFFGLNLTAQSIYYTDREYYREQAVNKYDFEAGFEYMNYYYNRTTRGTGFKLSAGFIYRPVAGLSIGASITTPTWKRMRDFWTQDVSAYSDEFSGKEQYSNSPEGEARYRMTTPFQWNVGLGYTIGKFAILSVDYSNYNPSKVVFKSDNAGGYYGDVNSAVESLLKTYHTVRAGAEVRVAKGVAIRGGYNLMTAPIDTYVFYGDDLDRYCSGNKRQSWSVGLGYRTNYFFVDIAFQQQLNNVSEYLLYDDYYDLSYDTHTQTYGRNGDYVEAPLLRESFKPWKLLISLGFKF